MANFSKLCITDAGKRLLNLKLNAGDELSFVEMVMSERKYDMAVLEELTGLEGIRQRADIRKETRADDTIVVNAVFLNSGLEEGYFANTLGLYACLGKEEPVLFAVAVEQAAAAYMPAKPQTLSGMEFKLKITLENADQVTIRVDQSAMATVGDVLELENRMANHLADLDNPHRVSPAQLGIEEGANHYIHPNTHSAAMIDQDAGHRFATDAQMQTWNEKQSRTGDLKDNIVTFDSEDMANPTGWTDAALISSKEKLSSLTRKFSLVAKNVRYLWKLIGNTPLTIGDGTIIGAINTLNTGLTPISLSVTVYESEYIEGKPSVIVEYVLGMAFLLVYFPLKKDIPEWNNIVIAQINGAHFGTTYSAAVYPNSPSSALLITVEVDGKICASTHGAVSGMGWYYTSFPARCILI